MVFSLLLLAATLLCGLTAGLVFAFAVVTMPGIGALPDREFLNAFKAMDRVIQNNHPLFGLVWVGSALLLIGAAVLGFGRLEGLDRGLLLGATVVYLVGVQVPTVVVNIPLNNRLQAHDVDGMDEGERRAARAAFEARWNRWNRLRTVWASAATALLLWLLLRL